MLDRRVYSASAKMSEVLTECSVSVFVSEMGATT